MKHQTLPLEEKDAHFHPSNSLLVEQEKRQDSALHADTPTSQTDTVEILGAELSQHIERNQKREGRVIWSIPLFYSLMALVLFVGKALLGDEHVLGWMTAPLTYVVGFLFWSGITGFMIGSIVNPRKRLRPMAQALADQEDVRATGSLIDTLKLEDRKIRGIAVEALIKLLPRLQPGDAHLLNAEQRAMLCRKLGAPLQRLDSNLRPLSPAAYEREVSFRISILQGFAQVGDSRALPFVERLAQREAKTAEQQRIQEAARECLPLLQLRVEEQRSNQTLLRASSAADATGETLLRPLTGAPETNPDELLRPGFPNP